MELNVEDDLFVLDVGAVPLLVELESVDLSVRKLALERRRRSLRKAGAMRDSWRRSIQSCD